ncbi:C4-dicarboxylate TRAP transporter substrate-binding protein [Paenibacillus alkalitolerans]|uniref:C4-dicarboxylate TRAP transporter substrate-binding protein n=1 Tax=Paenibacillus alkalitolerans TaxID=2799335 RepID=UPI0018F40348|nr:C4-dicarboxylate TRAP transporter substrate-binding protein [Paenibacillus alkalitolerans]
MNKKAFTAIFSMMLILSLVLAGCGTRGAETNNNPSASNSEESKTDNKVYTMKVSYENNPGEPVDEAVNEWKRLAEEQSGGRLTLELYPSSQLGAKKDVIELMKTGTNVIAIADASFLADYVPDFGILAAPYLADDFEKLFKATQSDWFKDLEQQLQGKGLHIVTTKWNYGVRHLLTKNAVASPADLNGLKIRVPNADMSIKAFEAMGATPTPMPLGEVYPALSQGVVHGAENPLPVLYGAKLHEQAKHLSLTGHQIVVSQWLAGSYIETLPEDLMQILKETGDKAGEVMNEIVKNADEDMIKKMEQEGVTVSEVDRELFREAAKGVYDQFPEWSPGLYDKVQEIINGN